MAWNGLRTGVGVGVYLTDKIVKCDESYLSMFPKQHRNVENLYSLLNKIFLSLFALLSVYCGLYFPCLSQR